MNRNLFSAKQKKILVTLCCLGTLAQVSGNTLSSREEDSTRSEKVTLARAAQLIKSLPEGDPWLRNPDASTLSWGESYLTGAFINLYEATGDTRYLEEVAFRGNRMLKHRDDYRGVTDGSGKSRPAWSMGSKYVVAEGALLDAGGKTLLKIRSTPSAYNNSTTVDVAGTGQNRFTLLVRNEHFKRYETYENLSLDASDPRYVMDIVNDPLAPYSTGAGNFTDKKSNLVRIEGEKKSLKGPLPDQKITLTPVPLAYTGYLGVIYYPLMRFAEIVKNNPALKKFLPDAGLFIKAAEESYADASRRVWREVPGKEEGYYLMCEKGESMPADNVGQPFNYLAKHVCTELALYRLTGKKEYLDRSKKMINLFKNRLIYDETNDLYVWNYWFEPMTTTGWKPEDHISYNVKMYPGKARVEDISHGGHDIQMVMAGYKMGIGFDKTDVQRFANTFLRNVLTPDKRKITRLVDGSGDYQAYFNSIHQWFVLSEVVPEVFGAGKEIYENRTEESLPFTAQLLKYDHFLKSK